jgi:hypothetical protein
MFRVSIAPIIRRTQNCNCSLCYKSVSEQQPSSNVAKFGHVGGRLLLYQRLQLQFYVLLMMGAMDIRNM